MLTENPIHIPDLLYKSRALCGVIYPGQTTNLTEEKCTCIRCIETIKKIEKQVPVPAVWVMMIDRFNSLQK